jgi:hypothetical protein
MTESSPFEPDKPDKETPNESFAKRWVSLLRRRDQAVNNESESKEEDDEDGEKPKKWRKLFGKIFPKVVEPPVSATKRSEKGFDLDTWSSWSTKPVETDRSQQQSEQQSLKSVESPNAAQSEQDPTSDQTMTPEKANASSEVVPADEESSTQAPTSSELTQDNSSEQNEVIPEQLSLTEQYAQSTEDVSDGQDPIQDQSGPSTVFERIAPTSTPTVEKEVIIKRGSSNALPVVLVAAEHFGRKRADRKLEKRLTDKLDASKSDITRGKIAQEELQQVISQNREQIESLKRQRMQHEQAPVPKNFEPSPSLGKEKIISAPEKKQVHTETASTQKETREVVQPRKIFEQVANAAEHNVPVERVFERSHEVKDDTPIAVGAASVGSVMATQAVALQQLKSQVQNYQTVLTSSENHSTSNSHKNLTLDTYQQAIAAGFWSAIVIIVLGSIAYLMIK